MARSSAIRVLVADDSAGQRRYCRVVLETAGIEVSEAPDGRVALQMMAAEPFDVLILDLAMPVSDGFEVLRRLPGAPVAGETPLVIVCSSDASRAAARRPEAFRDVDFLLQKPTEPSELLNAVSLLLQSRPALQSASR